MPELIEKDGKSIVVIDNEIELNELENSIKIIQAQIDNIDYNIKGLQQRRENLVNKLNQLNAIKESLPIAEAGATTAPAE
ncbi:MAG TPA: hypothetical protein PK728_09485 [Bacillota bacterium]|nr:hypothetical protein [Bacillota bacterium]